jgi:hypothetical protein
MRKKITIVTTALVMTLAMAVPAFAAGAPKGAGEPGKPAGISCQQSGIATLQVLGLLPAVAANGIEVVDVGNLDFASVLSLHRTSPELFQTGGVSVVVPGIGVVPATWCDGI